MPAAVCTFKAEARMLTVQAVSWQRRRDDVPSCLMPPGGRTCQNSSGGELHAADQFIGDGLLLLTCPRAYLHP